MELANKQVMTEATELQSIYTDANYGYASKSMKCKIAKTIPMAGRLKDDKTTVLSKTDTRRVSTKPEIMRGQATMDLPNFKKFADPNRFFKQADCTGKCVLDCIKEYLKIKVHKDDKSKRERNQQLINHLMDIERNNNVVLQPSIIGEDFFEAFELWLLEKGLSPNTIASLIGSLRFVMKWAALHGAKISADIDDYKMKPCDSKPKIALTEDDIIRIAWFDISTIPARPQLKKTLTRVRDHFIISCYLGQRYSDMIRLTEENFRGAAKDSFKSLQKKTTNNAFVSFHKLYGKYPERLRSLLEKYNFKAPFTGDLANYNRYLHLLCKYIGFDEEIKFEYKDKRNGLVTKTFKKYQLISSHTARRSFITNAVKRNVNVEQIKCASGHTSDSSFRKYVLLGDE